MAGANQKGIKKSRCCLIKCVYPAGKLERLKNVEWKEPLGKGLRVTSKIVGAVSDFVPFAGIVKGATSMVADMLDPPVTLEQIRYCHCPLIIELHILYMYLSINGISNTYLGTFKKI